MQNGISRVPIPSTQTHARMLHPPTLPSFFDLCLNSMCAYVSKVKERKRNCGWEKRVTLCILLSSLLCLFHNKPGEKADQMGGSNDGNCSREMPLYTSVGIHVPQNTTVEILRLE